jgi:hypothetical protein
VPSVRQLALLGIRTGNNQKGLSWRVASRWVRRRQEVLSTWLAAGCNAAEAGRRLGVSRQTVGRTLNRIFDGLALAAEEAEEARQRAERRWGRRAYRSRARRRERAYELELKARGAVPGETAETNDGHCED